MAGSSNDWEADVELKNDLASYVTRGFQRKEILDYMLRDFPYYKWSIRTLDRRLRYFQIFYNDKNVTLEAAREAVCKELNGPGRLLGYRAMHLKLRQKHGIKVPRDRVYDLMYDEASELLQGRQPGRN